MATVEHLTNRTAHRSDVRSRHPDGSIRFDLLVVVLCAWFLAGLYLDGWAHNHGRVDDTFLTPWHAVLYSGFLAVGVLLTVTHFRNASRGCAWARALPVGYMPALLGVILFGFAGAFDFAWHETFGFEENMEALLSPSHLLLAAGAFLFLTSPIRAAWHRAHAQGWRDLLPLVLSLTMLVSLFTFFTMYANLFNNPHELIGRRPSDFWHGDLYGVTSSLITSALMMGVILFALRRWRLPSGSIMLMLTANAVLMYWMNMPGEGRFVLLVIAGLLAGIVGDVLLYATQPSSQRPLALRLFALGVPFVYFLTFMLLLNQVGIDTRRGFGLWWEIHMWLGVPTLSGVVGLFLSYLAVPPALPILDEDRSESI